VGLVERMAERAGFEPAVPVAQHAGLASRNPPQRLREPEESVHFAHKVHPMTRIPVTKARKTLSDVVSHVAFGGDRVVLSRNGRDLAAIIPMDVYRRIEAEEDRLDLADLRRAKREAEERGEKPIPYEEVRAALGLAASPARRRRKGRRR
jgi:prevent-host-death family protein